MCVRTFILLLLHFTTMKINLVENEKRKTIVEMGSMKIEINLTKLHKTFLGLQKLV